MLANFLPAQAAQLTEAPSQALARVIRREPLVTKLLAQPIPTSFVKAGTGDHPILLLHGFDSSVLEFRRLLPLLAEDAEVWAVDLLGFGFTERLAGIPYSPQAIRTHLYEFWHSYIKRPVTLIGASMGGATAIEFSLLYPDCVAQLVLMDSVGYISGVPPIAQYLFPPLDYWAVDILRSAKVRQRVSEQSYNNQTFATADAALCGLLPVYMPGWHQSNIAFLKSGGYRSLADRIPTITQPTLILWGAKDQILDPTYAQRFQRDISNSTLVMLDNCGHVPHLEQPQRTADAIRQFRRA